MNNILVLFAHPVFQTSLINRSLIKAYKKFDNITFHDLYEEYPNFLIDVEAEQALLNQHDVIIFQHPLYWYSCPSILKEWMDLVLKHGYAYGTTGTALKDKTFLSVISTGGENSNYKNDHNIRDLLKPFEFTAKLCNMTYLPPFVTFGGLRIKAANFDQSLTNEYLQQQCLRFEKLLQELSQNQITETDCESFNTLNQRYDMIELHND